MAAAAAIKAAAVSAGAAAELAAAGGAVAAVAAVDSAVPTAAVPPGTARAALLLYSHEIFSISRSGVVRSPICFFLSLFFCFLRGGFFRGAGGVCS